MSLRAAALAFVLFRTTALVAHPEIDDALARLTALIAATPTPAALYLERGELYAKHADWLAAEANYLRAAELAPRLPGLDLARGALSAKQRAEREHPGEEPGLVHAQRGHHLAVLGGRPQQHATRESVIIIGINGCP
jgi:hypothetical protein